MAAVAPDRSNGYVCPAGYSWGVVAELPNTFCLAYPSSITDPRRHPPLHDKRRSDEIYTSSI